MKAKSKIGEESSLRKVKFEFQAPEAREVSVAGDFNGWGVNANPMKKDKKGVWKTIVSLEPGRYEYRFIVDGNWTNDPSCSYCAANEFGGENCVRLVD